MDAELTTFQIQPKSWRGVRDNEPANKILDEEWVFSMNVDSRAGGRRDGVLSVTQVETSVNVKALSSYRRPDGSAHFAQFHSNGKLFDDGSQVLSGLDAANYPMLVPGNGTIFFFNGVNPGYWRDPADGTWKLLQGMPSGWAPKYATFHPLNKRLYVAPTAAGVDYYAWTNADFVGSTISFVAPGGGAEYIGGLREPVTGLHHGLGDDLCIFTTDHTYQIRGLDPSSWRVRFVSGDVGCCSARTIVLIGHGLFFMHPSGCYLVNALGALTFPPLTQPKQRAWDTMIRQFEPYLQYAHATWNAAEHTVYLFIPTSSSSDMGQLWKFYLPDGSITTHDIQASSCCAFSNRKVYVGRTDGRVCSLQGENEDLGAAFTGQLRTKIYGEVGRVFNWGVQQKMVMMFAPLAGGTVRVTPRIYAQHERGIIDGTEQTINLDQTGDQIRATIYLPEDPGWGLQLLIEGESAWRWQGFLCEARRQDIE